MTEDSIRSEDGRREIRAVALSGLEQEGPAIVGMFRQCAANAEADGDDKTRDSFLEFADVAEGLMDELGAENIA